MIGILIITVTAFILSIILVLTSKSEELDNKEILDNLPGLNCGTCGFGSCQGMVDAIKEDKDNYLKCTPLRGEKKENLERILNKK